MTDRFKRIADLFGDTFDVEFYTDNTLPGKIKIGVAGLDVVDGSNVSAFPADKFVEACKEVVRQMSGEDSSP